MRRIVNTRILGFILLFSLLGFVALTISHAQSFAGGVETENGQLASGATRQNDAQASAGAYVKFAAPPSNTTYYIDCNGNDANNGTSQASAWKTLAKANAAAPAAGDNLLFKKGCTFSGSLTVKWTSVTIGAYGSGNTPVIQSGTNNSSIINITGSSNIIDGLDIKAIAPSTDPNCPSGSAAVGYINGVYVAAGAANNIIRNSTISGAEAGIYLALGSNHNHVLNNQITNNNMMGRLNNTNNNDDAGAFGVLLWGDHNEIAWNNITGSNACSYDYGRDGSAVEIYNASNNTIHHNIASNDVAFSELGRDTNPAHSADGNIYAYNQYIASGNTKGVLINIHGHGQTNGPVTNTKVYNNIAYVTVAGSPGAIVCSGCGTDILTLRNNILWDDSKALWSSTTFNESNNLYWSTNGTPVVQITGGAIDATSKKANPLWVNPGIDFHLQVGSPAIDKGSSESVANGFTVDLSQVTVPKGTAVDIGAFEH